jgi:peptidoglycan/xylan/chitin deacetylase (PgdA/CDA1 family)
VVVLTIDDGWIKGAFDMMLDSLAEHDIQATFFLIAAAADQLGPTRMQRLVTDGHEIAYHSYRHGALEDLEKWRSAEWSEDYDLWAETMYGLLGEEGFLQAVRPYARAPYGLFNAGFLAMAQQKGLVPISWSADAEMLAQGIPLTNGDILMLHVSTLDSSTLADVLELEDINLGPLSKFLPLNPPEGIIRDIPS